MPLSNFAKTTISSIKKTVLDNSSLRVSIIPLIKNYSHQSRVRKSFLSKNIIVPPIIVFSITNQCNLSCSGCYHRAKKNSSQKKELSIDKMISLLSEAEQLGVGVFVIAGGEPLIIPNLFEMLSRFPKIVFFVFTNGSLLNTNHLKTAQKSKNIILVFSIEGDKKLTDSRRGNGIYDTVINNIMMCDESNIAFGISCTLTSSNIDNILSEPYKSYMISKNCHLFFFPEFVAIDNNDQKLVPNNQQREKINNTIATFRKKYSAVFFTSSDEDQFGGCLGAGKGFLHINAYGDLEPCPMAPFSDINLNDYTLEDGLKSKLFSNIRNSAALFNEKISKSGCALWDKRDWVRSIMKATSDKTQKNDPLKKQVPQANNNKA